MKPSAPSTFVWVIGMLLGILGIIGHFITVEYLTEYSYWLLFAGFVLLALGTSFKGL